MRGVAAPGVQVGGDKATVTSGGYQASISLANARIDLQTPRKTYHLKTSILYNGAWVEPAATVGAPVPHTGGDASTVEITYNVAGNRQFIVDLSAYRNVPGIYLVSRLKNLGPVRTDYYFWSWEGGYDSYQVPGDTDASVETVKANPADYSRFGAYDWVYLPEQGGGLAAFTKQTLGRGPDGDKITFLNSIPNNQIVGKGGSMDMGVGLVDAKDAHAAASLFPILAKKNIPALNVAFRPQALKGVDYGKPAPRWVRNIDKYNCFPFAGCIPATWTDAEIKEWFSDFQLISHVPNDRALIARFHKAGMHVIMYVNFMEILNSEIQKQAGPKGAGYLNDNWGKIVDHENMDLARHLNWVAYDQNGNARQSAWGVQTNVPGLFNTCLHQMDLHDAAVQQVKDIMATGVDGIFIDNAGPIQDCFGDKFGKHKHAYPEKSNTEMYDMLMKRVYKVVKSYGDDKIMAINSGINPDQWSYSDVQMWESCLYGSGVVAPTSTWEDAKYSGELQQDAIRHGKVPVILSYFDAQPIGVRADKALYTYAYSRLYNIGWGDWFTIMGRECDVKMARAIYSAKLGKPAGGVVSSGRAYYRVFQNGVALVNPDKQARTVTLTVPHNGVLNDVCFDDTLTAKNRTLTVELRPASGKVLLWK